MGKKYYRQQVVFAIGSFILSLNIQNVYSFWGRFDFYIKAI